MKLNTLAGMKREEGRAQSGVSAVQGAPRRVVGTHSTTSPVLLSVATWTSLRWTVPITHCTASLIFSTAASQSREVSARIGTKTPAHRCFDEIGSNSDFSQHNWATGICHCGSCNERRQTCLFISHVNPATRPIQTHPGSLASKVRCLGSMKLVNAF